MTLTLSLPPEMEARLRERAAATGEDVTSFVRAAVEEKLAGTSGTKPDRTPEQWEAEFNAWVSSHRAVPHFVDDSRDSIYSGRGE